jgi:hypothetical protein
MAPVSLPEQPSLVQLRKLARDLQRAVNASNPDAIAEVDALGLANASPDLALHVAQLAIARRYGFASWPKLKRHLEVVERYTRVPSAAEPSDEENEPLADRFLRLACLSYEDDNPARWDEAHRLLAERPEIGATSVHTAAATTDIESLQRLLGHDRTAARRDGGPYRWEPLMYLAYARHDPVVGEHQVLGAAGLLLDAGADPNAGYLWHGLPTPFTVLTGVFGHGELGPRSQPPHPHARALAEVLLDSGADANDGQALYNRMFERDDDHLVVLLEHGLGTGDGGPWKRRLGDALPSPAELVRGQLAWAITHGFTERVHLLVDHGADVVTPFDDGATTTSTAATTGHLDLAAELVGLGAPPLDLEPVDAFVASVLAGDASAVARVRAEAPDVVARARAAHPALTVWAAGLGDGDVVALLVECGFDVNALGRSDIPSAMPWQTALHVAAGHGDLGLVERLLASGADPDIRDARFQSTPLGWAHHFEHHDVVEVLAPLTAS